MMNREWKRGKGLPFSPEYILMETGRNLNKLQTIPRPHLIYPVIWDWWTGECP